MTKAELYKKACMLPLLPGVYIIRDKSDTIIYIGKAKRLKTRVSQYFREGVPHDAKVSQMIAHAFTFDVIVCQSEFEALVLEASQIKAHTPKYNILLKDDKGYSYVKVTRGAWPRISAALQKDDDDADYIGPFTSSFAVREMVETAQDCFLLPRCNKNFPQDFRKGRPCLNAHIGKCMAVCSGKITCEAYNDAVQGGRRWKPRPNALTLRRRRCCVTRSWPLTAWRQGRRWSWKMTPKWTSSRWRARHTQSAPPCCATATDA